MATVEFDSIADVYDETRRALDEQTLAGLKEMFEKHGCRSVLEVAVGTGRIASPLRLSGYEVAGLDISRRMMERAKQKGIENLVLADGGRIPFRDRSFDAALMAHVFHILEDPFSVVREAARVTEVGVFALLRKRDASRQWGPFFGPTSDLGGVDEATRKRIEERREKFRKIAEKYHYDWEHARGRRNWGREQEVLQTHPPDDLRVVSDVVVNDSFEERIARFEKGAHSYVLEMPAEMREEIVREMKADASSYAAGPTRQPRHEVYQVAMWRSENLLR